MNPRIGAGAVALLLGALGLYFVTDSSTAKGLAVGPCGIGITSPARSRDGKLYLRSGQSLTVALAGTATRCPNTTLTRTFNDGGTASITVDDAGTWTSSAVVVDGLTTISVASVDGGTVTLVVDADTSRPRIQLTAPGRDDWDVWYLVSSRVDAGCGSGGNINAERFGRPGYVSDIDCADGGQVSPAVTVTGASGGWLSVTWNGVALVDAGISSSPATLTAAQLGMLTLPELSTGELAFTATTAGGASSSLTTYATVRTISPPALLGADGGAPVLTLLNARGAWIGVEYVLPHVPAEIGAAHTEFVWTTSSVVCGGGATGAVGSDTCYSLDDGDAGFFLVNSSTTAPGICGPVSVPDGGCAYNARLIWVKLDGGYSYANTSEYPTAAIQAPGDRLGVRALAYVGTTCTGNVQVTDPRGGCVSTVSRPAANAFTMSDGGGSTRDFWDGYYTETGFARSVGAYPVFDPLVPLWPSNANAGFNYLSTRAEVQDCRLLDAEASPQTWRCVDGLTVYEGGVRSGRVRVPPLNSVAIIPVLGW